MFSESVRALAESIQIGPSILAADFTRLGAQLQDAEAGGADYIHIDVMDGRFVPNIAMGPLVVEAARRATSLPLDVHLMMIEPDHMLQAFTTAGAATIHVHWETGFHIHRTLSQIKALGCRAGIAINPHTPIGVLTEVLPLVDVVLVMTVNPGFGGQALIPQTLEKTRQARALIRRMQLSTDVMVDGGINEETAATAVEAGANMLVVGSAVFNHKFSVHDGIERIRSAVAGK
jgi:ribulose-phosphate 3-epimerase